LIIDAIEVKIDKFFEMHEGKSPETGLYERVVREVERAFIRNTISHANGCSNQSF
jgi:DNA-binding protein Fis